MKNFIITTEITNIQQAKRYIDFIETQYIYHPDDLSSTVVDEFGNQVYTEEESTMIDMRNEEIFKYIDDPYEYIMKLRKFKEKLS